MNVARWLLGALGLTLLLAGACAIAGWASLVAYSLLVDPMPGIITRSFLDYVTSAKVLLGAEFDKAYAKHMVEDHEKAVKLFENASKNIKDPGLKDFATKTLPTIKEHLEMAKKLEAAK